MEHQAGGIIWNSGMFTQRRQNRSVGWASSMSKGIRHRCIIHLPLHYQRTIHINYATDHNAPTSTGDFILFFTENIKS